MPNFTQNQLQKITKEILTSGEIEARQIEHRLRDRIPIDDETWRQIQETAAEVGIPELEF